MLKETKLEKEVIENLKGLSKKNLDEVLTFILFIKNKNSKSNTKLKKTSDEWEDETIPAELEAKYAISLNDLLKQSKGKSKHEEIDFGSPVGKEVW